MSSLRLRALETQLRLVARRRMERVADPTEARAEFEAGARIMFRQPSGLRHVEVADQPDRITAGSVTAGRAILYFHGGGYITGSPRTHAAMLGRLSRMTGTEVRAPRYPLAPEHPHPAAYYAAVAAWDALLGSGLTPGNIVLGGDSAGGGLALALLSALCLRETPPAAAFALSPWTDLTLSGDSLRSNAATEVLLPVDRVEEVRGYILPKGDPADPRLSPLFADFPGCPPVRIDWSATEILRDDSRRMVDRLRSFGADVEAVEIPHAPHVWPLFHGYAPEADVTLRAVARFVQRSFAPDSR
ncbi:alpha/beta hydrolase fold domain-containing protein [Citreimonas salinaria]|uniref:Acetyl esterase/lipase n=1 Tax=Citreimonas salinaria TaxID=321339 RepID=A0A1H3I482_9RHOB|nr:alpha/beta hydrolase fold domain-containing protein [Citreimonas salinaria]SDY21979.1 Acetyl esterase/lipase [Citreimonas salinaria]